MLLNRICGRRLIRRRWVFIAFLISVFVASCSSWSYAQAAPLEQPGCLTTTSGTGIILAGPCPSFTWIKHAEKQPTPVEELPTEETYDPVTAPPFNPNGHWTLSGEPRTRSARSQVLMLKALMGLVLLAQNMYDFNAPPPCQSNIEGAPGLVICSSGMFLNGSPYEPGK